MNVRSKVTGSDYFAYIVDSKNADFILSGNRLGNTWKLKIEAESKRENPHIDEREIEIVVSKGLELFKKSYWQPKYFTLLSKFKINPVLTGYKVSRSGKKFKFEKV